jgi:hypothetical protein
MTSVVTKRLAFCSSMKSPVRSLRFVQAHDNIETDRRGTAILLRQQLTLDRIDAYPRDGE